MRYYNKKFPRHTQPCYIKVNDPRLLEQLEDRDYHVVETFSRGIDRSCIFCIGDTVKCCSEEEGKKIFEIAKKINGWKDAQLINCQNIVNLFLMIASLRRDDNDEYQIFTNGVRWKICPSKQSDFGEKWHKATVKEIVNRVVAELKQKK